MLRLDTTWLTHGYLRKPHGGERSNGGGQDAWQGEQAVDWRGHCLEWEGKISG
jgi:hypothetical protein